MPYREQICLAFLVENSVMRKRKRLVLPCVAAQEQITARAGLLQENKTQTNAVMNMFILLSNFTAEKGCMYLPWLTTSLLQIIFLFHYLYLSLPLPKEV